MNDKLRRAIKTGIIDEDYKDYLAVEKIPHDFSEKYEQRIGELIKTNRKSGHRHIKITLRFAAAIIAAVLAVGSVTVAAVPPLREWFVGVFVQDNNRNAEITHIKDNSLDDFSIYNFVKYVPTFVPSEFEIKSVVTTDTRHEIHYISGDKYINYSQSSLTVSNQVDTENMKTEWVDINGKKAFISYDSEYTIIAWTDGTYAFEIDGNLCKDDIIVTGIVALAIVSTMAVTTALATTSATKEVYGQSYAYYIHSVEVRTDKDNQIAIDNVCYRINQNK